jgi:hypothetical protein
MYYPAPTGPATSAAQAIIESQWPLSTTPQAVGTELLMRQRVERYGWRGSFITGPVGLCTSHNCTTAAARSYDLCLSQAIGVIADPAVVAGHCERAALGNEDALPLSGPDLKESQ